jgi:hypothetical protein
VFNQYISKGDCRPAFVIQNHSLKEKSFGCSHFKFYIKSKHISLCMISYTYILKIIQCTREYMIEVYIRFVYSSGFYLVINNKLSISSVYVYRILIYTFHKINKWKIYICLYTKLKWKKCLYYTERSVVNSCLKLRSDWGTFVADTCFINMAVKATCLTNISSFGMNHISTGNCCYCIGCLRSFKPFPKINVW